MKRRTDRKAAMSLRLSADEMATLNRLADERGMPKVSLIRQWIRDYAAAYPTPAERLESEALVRELRRVLRPKKRRVE